MWNVIGKRISPWLTLEPVVILYEYDGPKIFTCKDPADNLYLAYYCDEDAAGVRFLVVAFSDELVERLTSGIINMRDALTRPRAWIFDIDNDSNPVGAWRIDVDDLPPGMLPQPGVMLWKHQACDEQHRNSSISSY